MPDLFTSFLTKKDVSKTVQLVTKPGRLEMLQYISNVVFQPTSDNANTDPALGSFINSVQDTTIKAIVPCYNGLITDDFFSTNGVLYFRNDYSKEAKEIYEPVMELKHFGLKEIHSLISGVSTGTFQVMNTRYKWEHTSATNEPTRINTGAALMKMTVRTVGNSPAIEGAIENISQLPTSLFHGASFVDMHLSAYMQTHFLKSFTIDKSQVQGQQVDNYIPVTSTSLIGFKPLSYLPIEADMIDNAARAFGLVPLMSYIPN